MTKRKRTNNDRQNITQKNKDRATRTPLLNRLATNPVISHDEEKIGLWLQQTEHIRDQSFVTQILRSG